jgi:hypothetical protein
MLDVESVAKDLFDKIRSRFEKVSVGDKDGKDCKKPADARIFNFNYVSKTGDDFGNIEIQLQDASNSLKFIFSKNLSTNLDEEQKAEWYDFLRDMRMFARRNVWNFDVQDISKGRLAKKDRIQQVKANAPETIHTTDVTESKLYGNTKTSFKTISPTVRLRIRHTGAIDETKQGARSRYIESVFLEDDKGQRLLSPCKNLAACSALGQHMSNGGHPHDDFGKHIVELANEMSSIKRFVSGTRHKTYEDSEANEIASAAKHRHHEIRSILAKVSGPRGYHIYHENWTPAEESGEVDTTALREKFVQHKYDDRLNDGLPHAYKAYENMKRTALARQVDEFAESLDHIVEGTWSLPDNDISMQHLQELMSEPLEAGVDGNNATGALYDILGDDDLFDRIYDASRGSPEMDVRPIVSMWLEKNMPSVFAKLEVNDQNDDGSDEGGDDMPPPPPPAPEEPPAEDPNAATPPDGGGMPPPPADPNAAPLAPDAGGQPPQDPNQPPPPPTESAVNHGNMLADIRRLAGLR